MTWEGEENIKSNAKFFSLHHIKTWNKFVPLLGGINFYHMVKMMSDLFLHFKTNKKKKKTMLNK